LSRRDLELLEAAATSSSAEPALSGVRSFLGLANFFGKFISDFFEKAAPSLNTTHTRRTSCRKRRRRRSPCRWGT
jgi:hypothetical protein